MSTLVLARVRHGARISSRISKNVARNHRVSLPQRDLHKKSFFSTQVQTASKLEILSLSEVNRLLSAKEQRPKIEEYLDKLHNEVKNFPFKELYAPWIKYGVEYWNWPESVKKQHAEVEREAVELGTSFAMTHLARMEKELQEDISEMKSLLTVQPENVDMGPNAETEDIPKDELDEEELHFIQTEEEEMRTLRELFTQVTSKVNSLANKPKPRKYPWDWFKSVAPVPEVVSKLEQKDKERQQKWLEILKQSEKDNIAAWKAARAIHEVETKKLLDLVEQEEYFLNKGVQLEVDNWTDIEENLFEAWVEDITAKFPHIENETLLDLRRGNWNPEKAPFDETDYTKWWIWPPPHEHGHGHGDAHGTDAHAPAHAPTPKPLNRFKENKWVEELKIEFGPAFEHCQSLKDIEAQLEKMEQEPDDPVGDQMKKTIVDTEDTIRQMIELANKDPKLAQELKNASPEIGVQNYRKALKRILIE